MRPPAEPVGTVRVWDRLVRAFHWTLVISLVAAWFSAQENETLHDGAGYLALALIGVRIVWGFIGGRYARFSQFVRSPRAVLEYLRAISMGSEARFLGHNPAGGAMILALMIGVIVVSASGWLLTTDEFWGVQWAQRTHSVLAHGFVVLIVLHLAGVAVASWHHHENLVLAMVRGVKRAPDPGDIA